MRTTYIYAVENNHNLPIKSLNAFQR